MEKFRNMGSIDWAGAKEVVRGELLIAKPIIVDMRDKYKLSRFYKTYLEEIKPEISRYSKLELEVDIKNVRVLNCEDWANTNLKTMETSMGKLNEIYDKLMDELIGDPEKMDKSARAQGYVMKRLMGGMGGMGMGGMDGRTQMKIGAAIQHGVMMGMMASDMSQKVFGQYDPEIMSNGRLDVDVIYFLDPNMQKLSNEEGIEITPFRKWIAMHEYTHYFQHNNKHSAAWFPQWFKNKYDEMMDFDMDEMVKLLKETQTDEKFKESYEEIQKALRDDKKAGEMLDKIEHDEELKKVFDSRLPEKNQKISDELQAVMCVIEGHADFIMDRVGENLLPEYGNIKQKFEEKRSKKTNIDRLEAKLQGLDKKMEQYQIGEVFVGYVVDEYGMDKFNEIWKKPENLPTLEEINNPANWGKRLEF